MIANVEAESALLGAILLDNRALGRLPESLRSEHFSDAVNAALFGAIVERCQAGQIADPITLKGQFDAGYLGHLIANACLPSTAADYAALVLDLATKRALLALAEQLTADANGWGRLNGMAIRDATETELRKIGASDSVRTWQQAAQWIGAAIDQAQAVYRDGRSADAIETGIGPLDRRIGGLHASELIVLAGRPGSGKSALAQSIATNVARRGIPVFMFSHEMSAISLGQRALASETGVSGWKQRHGPLEQEQIESLIGAADRLRSLPLLVDDSPTLTVAQINRRARRIAKPGAQGLVVVDQLSHVKPEPGSDRQPRYQQVGAITRGFKEMAKELGLPVLLLSQLSRGVEARDDKRPRASDLRESGDIEGDADMILMVYREFTYLERSKPQQKEKEDPNDYRGRLAKWQTALEDCRHKTEVIIEKQRMGATGSAELYFDAERTSFTAPEGDVGSDLD